MEAYSAVPKFESLVLHSVSVESLRSAGDGNRRFRIYYWLNPPPGINTVVVSNPNTGPNELDVSAMLFTNVNQATPLGDVVLDVSTDDRTSESETVNTTSTDLVVHVIANALDNVGGTLGPGETAISIVNDTFFKGDASLMISTKPGGNPNTTVSSSGWQPLVVNGVAIVLHGNSAGGGGSSQRRGQLISD